MRVLYVYTVCRVYLVVYLCVCCMSVRCCICVCICVCFWHAYIHVCMLLSCLTCSVKREPFINFAKSNLSFSFWFVASTECHVGKERFNKSWWRSGGLTRRCLCIKMSSPLLNAIINMIFINIMSHLLKQFFYSVGSKCSYILDEKRIKIIDSVHLDSIYSMLFFRAHARCVYLL